MAELYSDNAYTWSEIKENQVKNKSNKMTTSKIKSIDLAKDWGQGEKKTTYYNLTMENDDKINIGRKSKTEVGTELTYEIIGDLGQHEYTKAKRVDKPKNDDYVKGIEVGHAINNAVNMICAGVELNIDPKTDTNEEKIYLYAQSVMAISNRLKNE